LSKVQVNEDAHVETAEAMESDGDLLRAYGGRAVRASLIALVALTVALLSIHALNSYDVWTHLACGRLIWEERRIPDSEPFSYSQNREMTLEEAEPVRAFRRTVFDDSGRLVLPAGALLDARTRGKLEKAGIPLSRVDLKIEPPLKRLTRDAVDANGSVVVRAGTMLDATQIARLRQADVKTVHVTVPWVDHEWFFQVLAYLSYKWWGLSGPIFYKTVILMVAYFFVFLTVYRRETHVVGVFAVFLSAMVSYKRFYMRPEVFSILFTGVWLYLLERFRHRQHSWSICVTLPLLMVVWINAHGYFILGPAIMLVYLIGEGVQGLILMPRKSTQMVRRLLTRRLLWRENVIDGKGLGILGAATGLTIAATFVNPYGWAGARYPIDVLAQVADPTSVIRTIIGEMQPPFTFSYTYAVFYTWVLLWVSAASWVLNIRRLKFSRLILYIISIVFLCKALRNMPFFGIPAAVFLGLNVNEAWDETVRFLREAVVPEALLVAKWVGQAALAALMVFFCIWIVSDWFYIRDVASVRYGLGYTEQKFSMGALEFIRNHPVEGNLFNSFGFGGLTMWKLYPEERPGPDGEIRTYYGGRRLFVDGRAEVYGGPFVKNYTMSLGDKELWQALDDKFHFQVILLNWQASDTHPLLDRLYRAPDWALCYGDGVGYVMVRNTPANQAVIQKARRSLEHPQFVDFAEAYGELARCLPAVPSYRQFVGYQDRIWRLVRILCADPHLGEEARRVSDTPGQVQFDRRTMANGYDRFREHIGLLPQRVISPGEMVGRAGFALRANYPELADAILYGLMQLSPEVPEFYVQRANIYLGWGETWIRQEQPEKGQDSLKSALQYFRKAQELQSDYPGLTLQLMRVADMMGDARLSAYYLERALDETYLSVNSTSFIAVTCVRHRRYREALKLYSDVLDKIPEGETSGVYERIAFCYLNLRDPRRALTNVNRALRLDDRNAAAWLTLGLIQKTLGDRKAAIEALGKCLAINPDFTAARKILDDLQNPTPRPTVPPRGVLPGTR